MWEYPPPLGTVNEMSDTISTVINHKYSTFSVFTCIFSFNLLWALTTTKYICKLFVTCDYLRVVALHMLGSSTSNATRMQSLSKILSKLLFFLKISF
jgi:hypothetical protein